MAPGFREEFPFHRLRVLVRRREAVVFRHVVGSPRDFFFLLLVLLQNMRRHPWFWRGELFARPGRLKRRERSAKENRSKREREKERERERESSALVVYSHSLFDRTRTTNQHKRKKNYSKLTCTLKLGTTPRRRRAELLDRSTCFARTEIRALSTSLGRPYIVFRDQRSEKKSQ